MWPRTSPSAACRGSSWSWLSARTSSRSSAIVNIPDLRVGRARRRPLLARPVGVELDAVAVRIGEVDRLRDAVVGGALDRRAGHGEAAQRLREREPVREEQREVVQAGVAAGGLRGRVFDEHDEVRGVGAEHGRGLVLAADPEAERVLVEGDRAVEAGDGEMDRAEPQRRGERGRGRGGGRGGRGGHANRIARGGRFAHGTRPRMHGLLGKGRWGQVPAGPVPITREWGDRALGLGSPSVRRRSGA